MREAWEKFFAQHEPEKDPLKVKQMGEAYQTRLVRQQQAVLETVQELKEAVADATHRGKTDEAVKKYEEIIALIEAALRHNQAQPWMYEVLSLSMKAAGRPQEDVDRAIMSAVEFVQNHADLMYLGAYLVQSDMDRRALQIFRQVSEAKPFWPEPLYNGMLAARRLHDVPGLEWSTAGLLGQVWPPAQAKLWEDAYARLRGRRQGSSRQQAERRSRPLRGGHQTGHGVRLRSARAAGPATPTLTSW